MPEGHEGHRDEKGEQSVTQPLQSLVTVPAFTVHPQYNNTPNKYSCSADNTLTMDVESLNSCTVHALAVLEGDSPRYPLVSIDIERIYYTLE